LDVCINRFDVVDDTTSEEYVHIQSLTIETRLLIQIYYSVI